MKTYGRIFILAGLLLLVSFTPIVAQHESLAPDTVSVRVLFSQGSANLNTGFKDNNSRIDSIVSIYNKLMSDPNVELNEVIVISSSSASPEGSSILNHNLAMDRARNTSRYLTSRLDRYVNARSGNYETDWKLLEEMLENSDVYYRDEALQIIRNTPIWIIKGGKIVDGRKRRLMDLYGGKAWQDMLRGNFSDMRYATVMITYTRRPVQPSVRPEPSGIIEADEHMQARLFIDSLDLQLPAAIWTKPKVALHNNMLLDVALIPNIGLEFGGDRVSVGVDWMYAWWNPDATHYWRIYGGDAYLRWYPSAHRKGRPFTGQHLGVYGGGASYDFEAGTRGYMARKGNWVTGLEYGVSVPVGTKLNIDFSLGLGYMGGRYEAYDYEEGYYVWKYTARRNWIGPTKADVSLVWLLGGHKFKPVSQNKRRNR